MHLKHIFAALLCGGAAVMVLPEAEARPHHHAHKKRIAPPPQSTPARVQPPPPVVLTCVQHFTSLNKTMKNCTIIENGYSSAQDWQKPIPPASLTKLMTADMIYEHAMTQPDGLDGYFTTVTLMDNLHGAQGERNNVVKFLNGFINAKLTGKKLTYREAILALTIGSYNNVAEAAARSLGQIYKDVRLDTSSTPPQAIFVEEMNKRAQLLGMTHTHFKNASGMPATGQLTTAEDMKILMAYLLDKLGTDIMKSLYGQREATIAGIKIRSHIAPLHDKNSPLIGAKTGTQDDDHGNKLRHIAGYAHKDDRGVITIILSSPDKNTRDKLLRRVQSTALAHP